MAFNLSSPDEAEIATIEFQREEKSGRDLFIIYSTFFGQVEYIMNYDEFHEKLRKVKLDFKNSQGKDLETIHELDTFLDRRLASSAQKVSKGAKSLRGLFP